MTVMWIPGNLLAAPTPAVMAGAINDAGSPVRAALDALYDSTDFASQADALSGVHAGVAMSPLRSRQAFDSWLPAGLTANRGLTTPEVAVIRMTHANEMYESGTVLSIGSWSLNDPTGLVSGITPGITLAKSGLYRFSVHLGSGLSPGADVPYTMRLGWVLPGAPSTAWTYMHGVAQHDSIPSASGAFASGSSHTEALVVAAGSTVRPWAQMSRPVSMNSTRTTMSRITVERLGPSTGFPSTY